MEESYKPFGPEWRNDMQKLNKETIITLYAEACKELHANAKNCKCGKQECSGVVEHIKEGG